MIHLAFPLAVASLLPLQEAQGEDALVAGLAEVNVQLEAGEWDVASSLVEALIEEHRSQDHVFLYLPELEYALETIEFAALQTEPEFADLISGELVSFKPKSNLIQLRYTPQTLGDFVKRMGRHELADVHPAVFSGSYKVSITGASYPRSKSWAVPTFYSGYGKDRFLCVSLGLWDKLGRGLEASLPYLSIIGMGADHETLARAEGQAPARGQPFELELEVRGSSVTVRSQGKKVMSARLAGEAAGHFALEGFRKNFEVLELRGQIDPGWLQGLRDADIEEQRKKYEETLEPRELLSDWMPLLDVASFSEDPTAIDGTPDAAEEALEAIEKANSGHRAEALTILGDALAQDPSRADLWYEQAKLLTGNGSSDEVLEVLRAALAAGAYTQELHELNDLRLRAARGPGWTTMYEVRSKHYLIRSDISKRLCTEASQELERTHQRFSKRFGDTGKSVERFRVYLFAGEAGYRRYARGALGTNAENTAGLYVPDLGQLLIWNLPDRDQMMETIRHEGFHQFLHQRVGRTPSWFNEGMAEYHEGADFTRGRSSEAQVHGEHMRVLLDRSTKLVPLERFVFQTRGEFYANADLHYPMAWLLVHFLQHSTPENRALFHDLIKRLKAGDDAPVALEGAFADVTFEFLDEDIRLHLKGLRE